MFPVAHIFRKRDADRLGVLNDVIVGEDKPALRIDDHARAGREDLTLRRRLVAEELPIMGSL
jgi:hypothetical protein